MQPNRPTNSAWLASIHSAYTLGQGISLAPDQLGMECAFVDLIATTIWTPFDIRTIALGTSDIERMTWASAPMIENC